MSILKPRKIKAIYILGLFASLVITCGCAMSSEFICGPRETEILSDPMGAKIEVDDEFVGITPLKVTLERECDWYNYRGAIKPIIIKAWPFGPKQSTQYRKIEETEHIPRRIIFHMYQQSSRPKTNPD